MYHLLNRYPSGEKSPFYSDEALSMCYLYVHARTRMGDSGRGAG